MVHLSAWNTPVNGYSRVAWSNLGPAAAQILAVNSAYDYVVLDAQHGLFDERAVHDSLHIEADIKDRMFVRPPSNSFPWIGRILDAGARGIVVPMVNNVTEAIEAVSAARFVPLGKRSSGRLPGPVGWPEVSAEEANARIVVGVMVETVEGLENVEAIAAVPGVDMIFVGPWDLSLSLGTTVDALVEAGPDGPFGTIAQACEKHGVVAGAMSISPERNALFAKLGYTFIVTARDSTLLQESGNGTYQ